MKPLGEIRHQQLQLIALQSTGSHLPDERCHPCFRLLPEQAALFVLLFIDVQAVVPVDRADQRGLDAADTLPGEVALLRIG